MEHFKIWNKISDILKRVNVKEKWQIKKYKPTFNFKSVCKSTVTT